MVFYKCLIAISLLPCIVFATPIPIPTPTPTPAPTPAPTPIPAPIPAPAPSPVMSDSCHFNDSRLAGAVKELREMEYPIDHCHDLKTTDYCRMFSIECSDERYLNKAISDDERTNTLFLVYSPLIGEGYSELPNPKLNYEYEYETPGLEPERTPEGGVDPIVINKAINLQASQYLVAIPSQRDRLIVIKTSEKFEPLINLDKGGSVRGFKLESDGSIIEGSCKSPLSPDSAGFLVELGYNHMPFSLSSGLGAGISFDGSRCIDREGGAISFFSENQIPIQIHNNRVHKTNSGSVQHSGIELNTLNLSSKVTLVSIANNTLVSDDESIGSHIKITLDSGTKVKIEDNRLWGSRSERSDLNRKGIGLELIGSDDPPSPEVVVDKLYSSGQKEDIYLVTGNLGLSIRRSELLGDRAISNAGEGTVDLLDSNLRVDEQPLVRTADQREVCSLVDLPPSRTSGSIIFRGVNDSNELTGEFSSCPVGILTSTDIVPTNTSMTPLPNNSTLLSGEENYNLESNPKVLIPLCVFLGICALIAIVICFKEKSGAPKKETGK